MVSLLNYFQQPLTGGHGYHCTKTKVRRGLCINLGIAIYYSFTVIVLLSNDPLIAQQTRVAGVVKQRSSESYTSVRSLGTGGAITIIINLFLQDGSRPGVLADSVPQWDMGCGQGQLQDM